MLHASTHTYVFSKCYMQVHTPMCFHSVTYRYTTCTYTFSQCYSLCTLCFLNAACKFIHLCFVLFFNNNWSYGCLCVVWLSLCDSRCVFHLRYYVCRCYTDCLCYDREQHRRSTYSTWTPWPASPNSARKRPNKTDQHQMFALSWGVKKKESSELLNACRNKVNDIQ